jgi:hypothetical protein
MASLSSILATRTPESPEDNLEKGKIWAFGNVATYSSCSQYFCWNAPANGTVILEAIGAGGSGSRMCCCSATISGNSGSYARKNAFSILSGQPICGFAGKSCRNAPICFRGCSEAAQVCYVGESINGCMCAQGGRAGHSWCTTGTARWCCFAANNWCATQYNGYCGIICNSCPGAFRAQAYGGDINKSSVLSCVTFWHCYPNCNCSTIHHTAIAPGMFAEDGAVVSYNLDADNGNSEWSGMALNPFLNALNGASRMPGVGGAYTACWNGERMCQCYDTQGCSMFVPYGSGGPAATPCPGVRDNGWAGGDGVIRIKFIEN